MSKRNAQLLQMPILELEQRGGVDVARGESLGVLRKAERVEQRGHVEAHAPV
jgi:hypothetical protein